jgi:hypothetical protein
VRAAGGMETLLTHCEGAGVSQDAATRTSSQSSGTKSITADYTRASGAWRPGASHPGGMALDFSWGEQVQGAGVARGHAGLEQIAQADVAVGVRGQGWGHGYDAAVDHLLAGAGLDHVLVHGDERSEKKCSSRAAVTDVTQCNAPSAFRMTAGGAGALPQGGRLLT